MALSPFGAGPIASNRGYVPRSLEDAQRAAADPNFDPSIGVDEQTTTVVPAPAAPPAAPAPAAPAAEPTRFSVPRLLSGFADNPLTRGLGDLAARGLAVSQNIPKVFTQKGANLAELTDPAGSGRGAEPFFPSMPRSAAAPAAAAPATKPATPTQSTTLAKPEPTAAAQTAPEAPKQQESIEDLRRRMGLVEYGAPPRGATRQVRLSGMDAPQSYKPITQDVGDGRGSFSQMEIKPDAQGRGGYENIPYIAENRIQDKERGLYERGLEAGLEDISTVPPGTTRLPERGIDVRRRQEGDLDRQRLNADLAKVDQERVARMQALRSDPAYATMSPMERQMKEDEIREDADRRERVAWGLALYGRDRSAAGQMLRPGP